MNDYPPGSLGYERAILLQRARRLIGELSPEERAEWGDAALAEIEAKGRELGEYLTAKQAEAVQRYFEEQWAEVERELIEGDGGGPYTGLLNL